MSEPPPSGPHPPLPPTDPIRPAAPAAGPVPEPPGPSEPATSTSGRPAVDPWDSAGPPASDQVGLPQPGYAPPPGSPRDASTPDGSAPPGWPSQSGPVPPGPTSGWPATPHGTPPGWPMPGAAFPAQPAPGWYPGLDPNDPLVNPPYAGVGGWFARCLGAVRRGWRQLLPIVLLAQGVPAAVIAVLSLFLAPTGQMVTGPDGVPVLPDGYLQQFAAFYGVLLFAALVFGPLQAVGWGAGTWVVARQAAGEPAGVGAALRYGLRRALGLWGWTIVVSLLVTVGACFCLLPGVYAGFALMLFGPVYVFERQDPIGRSWRMFHTRFGLVLGRSALVACVLVAASVLDFVVSVVNGAVFGTDPTTSPGATAGAVTLAVAGALLAAPAYVAQLVGLVAAYAEQRAHEAPVNATRLAAELG
ncbi:hypothetical protein [Micromonospora sp. WMMD980]|uniref:hypothetical protein n=1 Tax=Micromonospora sp. WMMD980 TaxID=3016088 RepID=UPI0024169283|nr:hypothetical protein [Micromonospora sp. WMMD980]MDG4804403.1 hypothetical protein [Micromonospora sp. WMMD980]